jgi:hypothetical protein
VQNNVISWRNTIIFCVPHWVKPEVWSSSCIYIHGVYWLQAFTVPLDQVTVMGFYSLFGLTLHTWIPWIHKCVINTARCGTTPDVSGPHRSLSPWWWRHIFSFENSMLVLDVVETQWNFNLIQADVEARFVTVGPSSVYFPLLSMHVYSRELGEVCSCCCWVHHIKVDDKGEHAVGVREERRVYSPLMWRPEWGRPLGKFRRRLQENIKTYLKEKGTAGRRGDESSSVDTQQALLNAVMNIGV